MSALPGVSRLWTATTESGSRLLAWEDFALGRLPSDVSASELSNALVSARLELFPSGDFVARSNGATRTYRSQTGELTIDAGAPSFCVTTPRSEGFAQEAGANVKGRFADVTLRRCHGVFFIAALGEDCLADASRYLLMHTTHQLASGTEFENEEMAVQLTYGKLPLLVRRGEAEVALDRDLTGFRLYALGPDGTRGEELPLKVAGGKTTFVLSTAKALAYELVRAGRAASRTKLGFQN